MRNLHIWILLPCLGIACITGCTGRHLRDASMKYKATRDHDSLKYIASRLHKGTPRAEVEALVGRPDYSPTDGQYYYSSDKTERIEEHPVLEAVIGLVVEYRDSRGRVTDHLQSLWFGPIGE